MKIPYVIKCSYKTGQNMYIVHIDVERLRLAVFYCWFLKGIQRSPFIGLEKREIWLLCSSVHGLLSFTSSYVVFHTLQFQKNVSVSACQTQELASSLIEPHHHNSVVILHTQHVNVYWMLGSSVCMVFMIFCYVVVYINAEESICQSLSLFL